MAFELNAGTQFGLNLDPIWFYWKTHSKSIQIGASTNDVLQYLFIIFRWFFGSWRSDLSVLWSIQFFFWNIWFRLFAWAQIPSPDSVVVKGLFEGGVEGSQTTNVFRNLKKWVHAIPAVTISYDIYIYTYTYRYPFL